MEGKFSRIFEKKEVYWKGLVIKIKNYKEIILREKG